MPNQAVVGAFPPVTRQHAQHVITWSTAVTADFSIFEHTDGVFYLRVQGCLAYSYSQ